jgi:hypothetical protein
METFGDPSTCKLQADETDGLWTAIFMASQVSIFNYPYNINEFYCSQCFRYATTKEEEARIFP